MQPTDLTGADLYARSALYATAVLRDRELADTFARRGKALARDQWDAVLARGAETESEVEPEVPAPRDKRRKAWQ